MGRPTNEPLYQTSVFDFPSIAASQPAFDGTGYVYARNGRPNLQSLEQSIAALEGAEAALTCASGMTAVLSTLLAATRSGDRVLCQRDVYGGTRSLFEHDAGRLGLTVDYVDAYEPARVAEGLARGARFLFVESLSNPLLREVDLAQLSRLTRAASAVLCVDNTMATPVFRRPLALGADLVLHSATKFLGGHHDLTAGVLAGTRALIEDARARSVRLGLAAAPFDAWLALRGLRTLHVRMQRSESTTRVLAARLAEHAAVRRVHFPGWGALLSFDVGDRAAAERVVTRCTQIRLTPSLGGTETAFSHSASSSHRSLAPEERAELGIGEGLLRLSVGLEEPDDLWDELARALSS
ncbi:MAG: Methionine gamma-lyase [Myxococcaceae bacterium]|nr:Methionine gamma-lyase [Myxococcaceae bacterium]